MHGRVPVAVRVAGPVQRVKRIKRRPVQHLIPIRQPVPVGVPTQRVGVRGVDFIAVGKLVTIGVRAAGVCSQRIFLVFAQAVGASYLLICPGAVGRPQAQDSAEFERSVEDLKNRKAGLERQLAGVEAAYAAEKDKWQGMLEVMTPICKAYCSDMAFRVTETALQVYGGYGYCSEYPVEQFMRDIKIASLYEGANGIQALDLIGRKLGMKKGLYFINLLGEMGVTITKYQGNHNLKDLAADVQAAVNLLAETGIFVLRQ
jgi:hypothetical protein